MMENFYIEIGALSISIVALVTSGVFGYYQLKTSQIDYQYNGFLILTDKYYDILEVLLKANCFKINNYKDLDTIKYSHYQMIDLFYTIWISKSNQNQKIKSIESIWETRIKFLMNKESFKACWNEQKRKEQEERVHKLYEEDFVKMIDSHIVIKSTF